MVFQKVKKKVKAPRYEQNHILYQYLLFHYGSKEDQMPFDLDLQRALNFPVRCVLDCLDVKALPKSARALELGCAVGRSSFELSRYCESVLAIDNSEMFISAAKQIQERGEKEYLITIEGAQRQWRMAYLPDDAKPEKITFKYGDALNLSGEHTGFDVVLVANILCRLRNPLALLAKLPQLTAANGQLILISPYSWSKEFTPKKNWLGGTENNKGKNSLNYIQEALQDYFNLNRVFDMPFMLREHSRKYELGIAQATLWTRKS
jgi:putative 4-mercaptohistidine N1-methyltranferase